MKFIKSKKGLTLIEIIISIAILSIIIGPVLSLTLSSVKTNKKSDEKMQALSLAQKAMEGIKSPNYIIAGYSQLGNVLTKISTEGSYKITETLLIPSQTQVVDEFSVIEDADADIVVKIDGVNNRVYNNGNGLFEDLGDIDINSIVEVKCDDSKLDFGLNGVNKLSITTGSNFKIDMKIYLPNINLKMNIVNFSDNGKLKLHFIKQYATSAFTFNKIIGNVEYNSIDPSNLPNSSGPIYRLYEVTVTVEKISTGEILQELKGYKKNS
ncbi:prepilin-type N-terminal cleavage/methylation domain-containing protein [Clostridium sp.]|uniref:prepilin-type N-terminal cleavage/methylation domain-containing protein n=1 Tax=Clostridium sp. TaxID=1506 RepID=UPI003D6D9666